MFEDALRIDPDNSQARVGLAHALTLIHRNRWDTERARVLARADEAVTRAIALSPNYAHAHYVKAEVLALSGRFDAALATYDRAIALDPDHAAAYVARGRSLIAIGRAAETVAPVEKAIRLSPRDPDLFVWYFVCATHTRIWRDAQPSMVFEVDGDREVVLGRWTDLASAYAWRGQKAEAGAAVAELLKVRPGFTVEQLAQDGVEYPTIRRSARSSSGLSREHGRPGCQNVDGNPKPTRCHAPHPDVAFPSACSSRSRS